MSASTRVVITVALAAACLAERPAAAQTPAEQAEKLNKEGKELFADKDFEGAQAKFREAIALSPQAKYFFNQCVALGYLERYDEAMQKCEQVEDASGSDAKLVEKAQTTLVSLREKAAGAGGPAKPPAGADAAASTVSADRPAADGPSGPPPQPPRGGENPFVAARASGPVDGYKWSIGGALGVMGNLSLGREVGPAEDELYAPGGAELRLFANFIISDAARLGIQASFGASAFAPGEDNPGENNLVLADIGGALFVHVPLFKRFFVTPLAGHEISVQQPDELSQGFVAFGAHGELGFTFVFGTRGEHSFSVVPAVNVYFPAGGEVDDQQPEQFGLDQNSATFGVSAGYAYRFSTPFGSAPLITLE